jgi:pimeloyl-ACP methyl ester carboxylesterase
MDDFKDINSTTIIITGDSDLVIPPDNSKWMQAQLEGSKLITMKGIGHMLAIEAPKELADIVAEYL